MKIPKIKDIKNYVQEHHLVNRLERWAKNRSFPGFFKVPVFDVVIFVYNELRRYDLITRANSIAYSFFMSLFPSLIALFTALPLFKDYILRFIIPENYENFNNILQTEIKRIMPGLAGDRLYDFIEDLINNPRFGLLSFGFLIAIFIASNGMMALMRGFEKSYMRTFKNRGGFKKRMIGILLTMGVGGMVVGSVILIIVGQVVINWLTTLEILTAFSSFLLNLVRWIAILLLFYISIAVIYRYGAPTRRRFKMFTPGAFLATFLCILSSVALSFYIRIFGGSAYINLYGSIGAILVLMIWIQLNSLFILIGFELNASIAVNRDLKEAKLDEEKGL